MRLKALTVSILVSLTIVAGFLWQYQNISDWLALQGYDPPARIAKLADDTTMNESTRRLFYINHPELNDKPTFRENCVQNGEQTIVLGCFISRQGIYLLDVEEKRLNGVIEVTAAHEVLHAAYDRLSPEERARVDMLTEKAFEDIDDKRVKDTIEQYRKNDPGVVPNELHSILGTEVEDLPEELEKYYSQYFKDRSKVVDYLKQYEQAFIDIRSQVENYDKTLANLKKTIDYNQSAINSQNQQIDNRKADLDGLLSARRVEEYNEAVPEFNAQVASYNSLIEETKSIIDKYNELVETRNKLATSEQELVEALDSSKLSPKD